MSEKSTESLWVAGEQNETWYYTVCPQIVIRVKRVSFVSGPNTWLINSGWGRKPYAVSGATMLKGSKAEAKALAEIMATEVWGPREELLLLEKSWLKWTPRAPGFWDSSFGQSKAELTLLHPSQKYFVWVGPLRANQKGPKRGSGASYSLARAISVAEVEAQNANPLLWLAREAQRKGA